MWLIVSLGTRDVPMAEPLPGASDPRLIVVADLGGTASALPYYRALNLLPTASNRAVSPPPPKVPRSLNEEAAFLPVHTTRLTPGWVPQRLIHAPGLTPFFLAGDDPRSRVWITAHLASLRQLGAVGFIVHVDSAEAIAALRVLASGLTLVPASADDLAERLQLAHYPALVTATGIEQ